MGWRGAESDQAEEDKTKPWGKYVETGIHTSSWFSLSIRIKRQRKDMKAKQEPDKWL